MDSHRNAKSSSFVALERSSKFVVDAPVSVGSDKAPAKLRRKQERTGAVIRNIERLQGIGTPQHQTCCRFGIPVIMTGDGGLGEMETTQEITQQTYCRPNPVDFLQMKGASEPWRSRRGLKTSKSEVKV